MFVTRVHRYRDAAARLAHLGVNGCLPDCVRAGGRVLGGGLVSRPGGGALCESIHASEKMWGPRPQVLPAL